MTYVGKGSANQVGKANAAGKLAFSDIAVAVTVASGGGGDYTSVSAAIGDGAKRINVVGYTGEDTNTYAADDVIIEIQNGSTWDMAGTTFGSAGNIDIRGNGTLRYEKGTNDETPFWTSVDVDGLNIINGSTANAPLCTAADWRVARCKFTGDLAVAGSGALVSACTTDSDLFISSLSSGCNISQVNVGGIIVDSGVNSTLSNIKV